MAIVVIAEYKREKTEPKEHFFPVHTPPLKTQEVDATSAALCAEFLPATNVVSVQAPFNRDVWVAFGTTTSAASTTGTRLRVIRGTTQDFQVGAVRRLAVLAI